MGVLVPVHSRLRWHNRATGRPTDRYETHIDSLIDSELTDPDLVFLALRDLFWYPQNDEHIGDAIGALYSLDLVETNPGLWEPPLEQNMTDYDIANWCQVTTWIVSLETGQLTWLFERPLAWEAASRDSLNTQPMVNLRLELVGRSLTDESDQVRGCMHLGPLAASIFNTDQTGDEPLKPGILEEISAGVLRFDDRMNEANAQWCVWSRARHAFFPVIKVGLRNQVRVLRSRDVRPGPFFKIPMH